MFNGVMAEVRGISLRGKAADELSYSSYQRVVEWVKHWNLTPGDNFKAVIAVNEDAAIYALKGMLQRELLPSWLVSLGVKPEHFCFSVARSEVKDGFFWQTGGHVLREFNVA